MKLQPDKSDVQTLTGSRPRLGGRQQRKSRRQRRGAARAASASPGTATRFEDLGARRTSTQLADLGAELVIFGSGARIRFPAARLARAH